MKKVMMNFGLGSQSYAAPHAEGVEMCNEGLLCASVEGDTTGSLEQVGTVGGAWDAVEGKGNESFGDAEETGGW